jgi:hypothetical protein
MHYRTHPTIAWLGVFFAGAVGVHLAACDAHACLAEYRSPDWLVADSPLVIIGEVEKVEKGYTADVAGRKGDAGTRTGDGPRGDGPKATVSTVRIMRILKGSYPKAHVRIGSGPIRSCSGNEEHFSFPVGTQHIFFLPIYPRNGEAALVWGTSVRSLRETEMVESRVARAIAYRAAYLSELQRENPKVHAAAVQLAEEMRKAGKTWPEANRDKETYEPSKQYQAAVDKLKDTLAKVDVEAIRAALALDWLSEEPDTWWRKEVWVGAIRKVTESRNREIAAFQRDWIRKTLTRAHVEKEYVDEYSKAAEKEDPRASLSFPPKTPWMYNYFQKEGAKAGASLSTDFILRYHSYERGMMVPAYAGGFSAEVLAGLDPKRVGPLIASLYQSDDERLRWLAHQAIGYMPGTEFVDLVLDDMVEEGHPGAWQILDHWKRPKETAPRLAAMVDLASNKYAPRGVQAMWRTLREGECFEPVCIEKAVAALEQAEKAIPKKKPAKESNNAPDDEEDTATAEDSEREQLVAVLHAYLAAAKTHREGVKPKELSADEYRQWFKAHPAVKMEEE